MIKNAMLFLFLIVVAGCQKAQDDKQSDTVATATIAVTTVKCEMCVDNITKALDNVEGVQKAEVDLKQKIATVQYAPTQVTLATLEGVIADAGYDANSKKRNEDAYHSLPRCCQ